MDLRHLRYFSAVVEARSFLKAAQRLHISQPPLSTQIRELEASLGVTLLTRSSRGVLPTAAGAVFYAEARAVLDRFEQAKAAARRVAHGLQGRLGVGFISIADYSILPPALRHFRRDFPDVDVQLHELTTDAQVAELAAGRLDVGIALAPVDDPTLVFLPLQTERLMLALPSHHPANPAPGERAARLRDLANEQFVMVPRALALGLHDLTLAFCHDCGFVPQVTQYAKQMQTVISLVSAGFGVALVPTSLRNLQRTGVTYQPTRERSPVIQIGLIHRKDDLNPTIAHFIACAQQVAALSDNAG
jgi:DNA-binding transcriptional LysR family regulator